jgi:multicomponent Na+:H+ antiporter subunit B
MTPSKYKAYLIISFMIVTFKNKYIKKIILFNKKSDQKKILKTPFEVDDYIFAEHHIILKEIKNNMRTLILKSASSYLLPVLLLFSVFILLRGHYLPGGGFVGGLVAAIAFVLDAFSNGLEKTKTILKIHPGFLMPLGLLVAFLSGISPMVFSDLPFMTGIWAENPIPVIGAIGSALFFDLGVYLVVIGAALTIIFTISESA